MKKCLIVVLILGIAINFWFQRKKKIFDEYSLRGVTLDEINHGVQMNQTFAELVKERIPPCTRPLVWRNMFDHWGSDCKDKDVCVGVIKERFLKFFGDRIIEAWPPTHISYFKNYTNSPDVNTMLLRDYLLNPKYEGWVIHTLQQLGTMEEYKEFLAMDVEKLSNFPDQVYLGSQFFLANGEQTGTGLHWAFVMNLFAMLSGRKRWLMVNPKYFRQSGCTVGQLGFFGQCEPAGYNPPYGNISIDHYIHLLTKELGVPKHEIIDVTLNPGDILVNCGVWMHAIENLTPKVSAFSMRFTRETVRRDGPGVPYWYWRILFEGYWKSLVTKLSQGWNKYTLLDATYYKLTGARGIFDTDPRFSLAGILNQKPKK